MDDEPEELVGEFVIPAVSVRAQYDEQGNLTFLSTEFAELPAAESVARVLAQLLTMRPALPRRDPVLARRFADVVRDATLCNATASEVSMGPHDHHACLRNVGHNGLHLCKCGIQFGGSPQCPDGPFPP